MAGKIVSQTELADILGKTPNTVASWTKQGMPCQSTLGKKGVAARYNTADVLEWLQNRTSKDIEEGVIVKRDEEARLARARATREEVELARVQGELVPSAEMEAAWSTLLANFRSKLLAMPSKLAPELADMTDPREVQGFLRRAVHEALEELARTDPDELCPSDFDPLGA